MLRVLDVIIERSFLHFFSFFLFVTCVDTLFEFSSEKEWEHFDRLVICVKSKFCVKKQAIYIDIVKK